MFVWATEKDRQAATRDRDVFGSYLVKITGGIARHVPFEVLRHTNPAKPSTEPVSCGAVREGDEFFCSVCGIRWAYDEDKPESAKCLQSD